MHKQHTALKHTLMTAAAAFLIPAGILLGIYALFGMTPFGDKSVLIMDMDAQYVDFFAAMREMVLGKDSLLYSWNMGLGGNFIGVFAYYLSSPLSLITLLFPADQLQLALMVLNLIKVGLCGLTFSLYLGWMHQKRDLSVVIFSVFYALMSYHVVYSMSLMWLDGVFWLPVLLIGVEKILRENKCALFVTGLSVLFVSNYYISYMVGIFCALYFLYRFFALGLSRREFVRKGLRFFGCALLAAGIAMVLLLPTFLSMFSGKIGGSNYTAPGIINFNSPELIAKLFAGNYDSITNSGLPSIFCSVAVTLLVLLYFFSRAFSVREKAFTLGIFTLFFVSFVFKWADMAWHLFQYPNWFPYRYAFVCCFFAISVAYRSFLELKTAGAWQAPGALAVFAVLGTVVKLMGEESLLSWESFWVTMALAVLYTLLFLGFRYKARIAPLLMAALFLISAGEAAYNADGMVTGLDKQFHYKKANQYTDFQAQLQPLLTTARQDSAPFYRVRKTFERSKNDAMTLHYKGITHYSSVYNRAVNDLLELLGMAQYHMWCSDYGSTVVTDSLFGIKYLLTKYPGNGLYSQLDRQQEISLYQNPTALPLGYMANTEILSLTLGQGALQNQNAMVRAMTGLDSDCLLPVEDVAVETYNLVQEEKDGRVLYEKEDAGQPGMVILKLTAQSDAPYYVEFPQAVKQRCRAWVNGVDVGDVFTNETTCTLQLGSFQPGEQVELILDLAGDSAGFATPLVYQLSTSAWQAAYDRLMEAPLEISSFSNTKIEGTVDAQKDGVLFTSIAADKGWTVLVDGEKVETQSFAGALMAIPLTKGNHRITLSYTPPGLFTGGIVSLISLGLAAALLIFSRKRRASSGIPVSLRGQEEPKEKP